MPTLHLVYGPPGAGKTTFARQLAQRQPAILFSPDEWMVVLHGTNPPETIFRDQIDRIFALIWRHAARALACGTDVVIDAGFWTRASRDEARRWAAEHGVACRLYAMRCSVAEARQRVLTRTAEMPPDTLEITGPTFDILAAKLEPLGADEAHEVVALPAQAVSESRSSGSGVH